MFTFPNSKTPILFQGITSEMGLKQLQIALTYGTNVVAGISQETHIKQLMGIPVYSRVKQAVKKFSPKITVIFSTPAHALEDVIQAAEAKIPLIICTTEHVPMHDALKMQFAAKQNNVQLLGPSSNGILNVENAITGTLPTSLFKSGTLGIIGRSSSLIFDIVNQLEELGIGVSKCITLGTDHLIGTSYVPVLQALLKDAKTNSILLVGQVHGQLEQECAQFLKTQKTKKKIFAYIPGRTLKRSDKRPLLGMKSVLFSDIIDEKKVLLEKAKVTCFDYVDDIGAQIFHELSPKKGKK